MKDLPSDKLAAIVIVYRLLGVGKDNAIEAMNELSKRKADGDDFDYESFISESLAKAPDRNKLKTNYLDNLQQVLKGVFPRGF